MYWLRTNLFSDLIIDASWRWQEGKLWCKSISGNQRIPTQESPRVLSKVNRQLQSAVKCPHLPKNYGPKEERRKMKRHRHVLKTCLCLLAASHWRMVESSPKILLISRAIHKSILEWRSKRVCLSLSWKCAQPLKRQRKMNQFFPWENECAEKKNWDVGVSIFTPARSQIDECKPLISLPQT